MPAIALYARVSTSEQNTEAQMHALRRYAQDRGAEAVEFVDQGVSGAKDSRPALDTMMAEVRRRRVSAVVVCKLDRLARSVRHLTSLAAELEALGVALVILDQAIDTSSPAGRLLFHVLGSISEFERSLILERVKAGQAAAKRRGTRFGRPEVTDRGSRERIMRLRSTGKTLAEVAELVGVSRRTVARVLARRGTRAADGVSIGDEEIEAEFERAFRSDARVGEEAA